ncbi:MAG: hypothetical protein II816_04130, partial [Elusimicrobia bacterium]|nr:hypothetical protein [Elusimicrobiota bacterium]
MKLFMKIFFIILIVFISFNLYAQNINSANESDVLSKYQDNKKIKQLILIRHTSGSNAKLKMYVKDKKQKNN